jgi:hypothetical protein
MNERNSAPKFDFRLAVVLIVYTILGLFLIKYYRYQINPDGISYISIAQKYLNGDFGNAINGYWGPLLSWLLMPFLYFSSDALLATKLLSLLTGLVAIVALRTLSYRFETTESIRTTILFSAVPVVLNFAFLDIAPDLLLACILLFYFTVIFSVKYAGRINKGIVCGALGGVAYLSKSFAFPFFISHFFIMNVLHYLRNETKEARQKVFHNFLAGFVVFSLISGVWIGLISNKYGKLTFGTSGKATFCWEAAPNAQGTAVLWQGFLKPPDVTAISAWEDPSYLEMPSYNPFGSWPNLWHQLKFAAGNIYKIAGIFMNFSLLSIATGIAYVLFWLRRFNRMTIPSEVLYPTVTIALLAGGYSLVLVESRYLWVIFIMSMLMGGYVLCRLFQNKFFTKTRRMVLLVAFFLSFAVPASQDLKAYANRSKGIYDLGQVLKSRIGKGHKIASNTNWPSVLYLSYHLEGKYYGVPKRNISGAELNSELEKYGIEYFFVWGGAAGDYRFLSNYEEISGGRIPGLQIYGLKKQR